MTRNEKFVYLAAATVGILAFSLPWIIEQGLTKATLSAASVNFGIGVFSSILVVAFLRALLSRGNRYDSANSVLHAMRNGDVPVSPVVADSMQHAIDLSTNFINAGIEKIFINRRDCYDEMAAKLKTASKVTIISGSMHSFWSIYREAIILKESDPNCRLRIALLDPASEHAISRASMDSGVRDGLDPLPIYAATIRSIKEEVGNCVLYDFCAPAATYIIDDTLYLSPYIYGHSGGQVFCVRIHGKDTPLFKQISKSAELLFSDVSSS